MLHADMLSTRHSSEGPYHAIRLAALALLNQSFDSFTPQYGKQLSMLMRKDLHHYSRHNARYTVPLHTFPNGHD